MNIEKAILCAADQIEKHPENWIRDYYSGEGRHCAIGWIAECYKEIESDIAKVEEAICEYSEEKGVHISESDIIAFNDDLENDNIAVANYLRSLVK